MSNGIHVVFGPGAVGTAVTTELLGRGERVRAVSRSGAEHLPADVEQVRGDAADPDLVRQACEGAAVLYNCVGAPYGHWGEHFPQIWSAITAGAAHADAKLIVTDNVYMYGDVHGKPMTEDLRYAATTRKGLVRAQLADDLMEAHASGRVRVAIGRASDFFGPRVRTAFLGDQVFGRLAAGKRPQLVGDPDLPHSLAYVPDIGRALVTLGEREEALGNVWHLPSPAPVTPREVVAMAAEAAESDAKPQIAPPLMLRVLGLFNSDVRELREMLYQFNSPFIVDASKYERAFGAVTTPMNEAVSTTYNWFRDKHAT